MLLLLVFSWHHQSCRIWADWSSHRAVEVCLVRRGCKSAMWVESCEFNYARAHPWTYVCVSGCIFNQLLPYTSGPPNTRPMLYPSFSLCFNGLLRDVITPLGSSVLCISEIETQESIGETGRERGLYVSDSAGCIDLYRLLNCGFVWSYLVMYEATFTQTYMHI